MSEHTLTEILQGSGPWTTAYVDGTGELPQVEEGARHQAVRDQLIDEVGAPEDDAAAIESSLGERNGLPSPSARVVIARDGETVLDRSFIGARLGPERLEHGALPSILPLLRHTASETRYLVVETSRDGADIRLETSGRGGSERETEIEGDTDEISKVRTGGLGDAKYQNYVENVWKQNQKDVAAALSALIREERPAFVAVSGDVRARQLLAEELTGDERALLVDVDANTRADGADRTALDDTIAREIDERRRREIADVRDRAAADDGSGGAEGFPAVIEALQQARVDTLVLDGRLLDDERTLIALDGPPWVVTDVAQRLNTQVLGSIRAAEALARAALLTDARVLIEDDEYEASDDRREERPVREPIASLRWADAGTDADPS
ncbi:baeRF2 domain-containing protein [Microbacterium sp. 22179]|uniref:baeRF2 domain-containing protein n=1 Tax=Microbacterium sp. 22179 TaxID=3453886 RepID=UPI003F838231